MGSILAKLKDHGAGLFPHWRAVTLASLLASALAVPGSTAAVPTEATDLDAAPARHIDTPAAPSRQDHPASAAPAATGPTPTKPADAQYSYSFGGWFLADNVTEFTAATQVTGNISVYARWNQTALPPAPADKTGLVSRIDALGGTQKGNFTDESWNAFQSALVAARGVRDNADATQAQVDSALNALNAAYGNLQLKKMIFCTRYVSTFWNWMMFIFLFGWIWMWFI